MAIRFDATGDFLQRTTNIPAGTLFTVCGWAQQSVDTNGVSPIFSLNEAAQQWLMTYSTDGSTLAIYARNSAAGGAAFASSPTLGQPFFWAIKAQGTAMTGYWRSFTANRFVTITDTAVTPGTTTNFTIAEDPFASTTGFNGLVWNVRIWDRVLSEPELLAESFSDTPVSKAALNSWLRMENASDAFDYSVYGRHTTKNGTLTTEYPRIIVPRQSPPDKKIIVAAIAATPPSTARHFALLGVG